MESNHSSGVRLAIVAICCTAVVGATAPYDIAMEWGVEILLERTLGNKFVGEYLADDIRLIASICHVGLYALMAVIVLVWNRKSTPRLQVEALVVSSVIYLGLFLGVSYSISYGLAHSGSPL